MSYRRLLLALYVLASWNPITSDDWTQQCSICSCIFRNGKAMANCTDRHFSKIPKDLSSEIRIVDFSVNPLYNLNDNEFALNYKNFHQITLENCLLESIHEGAFRDLGLLTLLDLSHNNIKTIKKNTFRSTVRLTQLFLSHNKLRTLDEGLIANLSYLQEVRLDNNLIENIHERTFTNLPKIKYLFLNHNRIKTIELDMKEALPSLMSLDLTENPWKCDCRLQTFRHSVLNRTLITKDTFCREPPLLNGSKWTDNVIFACSPVILEPEPFAQVTAETENVTLVCKVAGDPTPEIDWIYHGQDVKKYRHKYFTTKGRFAGFTYNNLTVANLDLKDRGEYRCIAKNSGGKDEKNLTLNVEPSIFHGGAAIGNSPVLVISLSIGLVVLFVLVVVLICLFCKKSGRLANSKRRDGGGSSEECINMRSQMEIKKGLMTEVNPICKPPRTTVSPSMVSGGTEVSEVRKNLLDSDSVFECDDESRSLDFDQPLLNKTHTMLPLDSDYRINAALYPPDLLPFPPRGAQVSPAGSNASTVIIDSRLPPHQGPQSPLQSPIYDQLSIYKTLPYNRSQSPFVHGMGTLSRMPRQGAGYVTIPRRPRHQSWSSEPPGDVIAEPLYDNLGLRTSATGHSSLSLNKEVAASTPRSNRMFPLSPTPAIDPIQETHEVTAPKLNPKPRSDEKREKFDKKLPTAQSRIINSKPVAQQPPKLVAKPPSAQNADAQNTVPFKKPIAQKPLRPKTPQRPLVSQTLPRNMNSARLTPSKTQWAMDNAEKLLTPSQRNSVASTDGSTTEGKIKKIPPRPPPKPRKRPSSTGPLFEDEGEDGTEV